MRLSIALLGLGLAVLVLFVPGSRALLANSTFEGNDGNMVVDTSGNTDWVSFKNSPTLVKLDDAPSGTTDDSFAGGTKEDDSVVSLTQGSIPDKNDLLNAFAASETVDVGGTPNTFLYLSWIRLVSNGDAHVDFELDQKGSNWSSSPVTINRTKGDLLISYDFVGNLNQVNVTSFTWDPAANSGTGGWTNQQDLTGTGLAQGAVNVGGAISNELEGGQIGAGNFGEAAINLTKTLNLPTNAPCDTFGSMFAKTRSSGSGDSAQLKDVILPAPIHVSTCGSIELKKHWVGPAGSTTLNIGKTQGGSDVATKAVSGSDGTTGAQQVVNGDYYVGESALSGYTTTTSCFNDLNGNGTQDSGEPAVSVDGTGKVHVNTNDIVVCTITNTFNKLTPTVGTTLKNAANDLTVANNASLPLGSGVYDTAQITGDGGFPLSGSVTFNFYPSINCTGTPVTESGVAVSGTSATSNKTAHLNLGAGSYSFNAQYLAGSDNAHNDSLVSSCEPFSISKATPKIATVVKNGQGGTVTTSPLGTATHDTAALSGAVTGFSLDAGATVTYEFFNTADCSGAHTDQTVTVAADGSVPDASAQTLGAGSYSYLAVYNGNSNYNATTPSLPGDCEPFTISKATPSIATVVKDGQGTTVDNAHPASLGTAIHDTSTLSGGVTGFSLDAGATVTYKFFATNDCSGPSVQPDQTVAVNADGTVPNATALTLSPGGYSYLAIYNGNSNYNATTPSLPADCEPFKISKATPAIATVVKNGQGGSVTTAALGTSTHDTATLSGGVTGFKLGDGTTNPPDGATVTYEFFSNGTCSGAHTDQTVTVGVGGTVPDASTQTLGAGSYSYLAIYNGNASYNATTPSLPADCEPFTISKATPTITTVVKNGQGGSVTTSPLGTVTHDTASLLGGVTGFSLDAGASVTYEFFSTGDCSGAHTDQTVAVAADGSVPDAAAQTLGAGSYSYLAIYNGNANYNATTPTLPADCEPFTISKASPTITTEVKNGQGNVVTTVALGTATHDTATLHGGVTGFSLDAGATVTYRFFSTGDCSGAHTDQVVSVAADGSVPDASAQTLGAGSYSYLAVYSGNSNYNATTPTLPADCEPFSVSKATPKIATVVKDGQGGSVTTAPLGTATHDTATLSGGVTGFSLDAGATVTYEFFSTADCSGAHTDQMVSVAADGSVPDASAQTLGAGSYSYLAVYSGNSNYNATTPSLPADCEPFTINKAQLAVSTKVEDTTNADVTGTTVGLGSVLHDVAHVTGGVNGFPATGGVTFVLYNLPSCAGLGQSVATDGLENGDPKSATVMSLVPGNYGFIATVAGDANYTGAPGVCEPFTVSQAGTSTATAIHNANHDVVTEVALGTIVHDSATVTSDNSSATPSGNVNFTFFPNGSCTKDTGSSAGSHALDNAGVADGSNPEGPLGAGSYSFQGSYVGDTNFTGSTGACEPLTVDKATPSIHTVVRDGQDGAVTTAPLGTATHDTATLSGGVTGFSLDAGATVKYEFFTTADCSGTHTDQTVAVNADGTVPAATPQTLGAGSYSYLAIYSGNANYNATTPTLPADCEPFSISKATPAIVTVVKDGQGTTVDNVNPATLGTATHDTAVLSGGVSGFSLDAGATVTYEFFTTNNCSGDHTDQMVVVAADGSVPSADAKTLAAGGYSYLASYSGNANYNATTPTLPGDCEPFSVGLVTPTLSTTVKDGQGATVDNANPAALGTAIHDTATLGGAVNGFSLDAGATVKYEFFANNSCDGQTHTDEVVNVGANGSVPDASPQTLAAGSYSYLAVYSGNANYNPQTAACEPFMVSKATPTLSTKVKDGAGNDVTDEHVALGTSTHDTATLGGGVDGFSLDSGSTVKYEFFTTGNCDSESHADQTVDVAADGSVPDADVQTLGAGSYSYLAVYSGNANYNGKTATCEPFTVDKGTPSAATTLHNASGDAVVANGTHLAFHSGLYDVATISNASGFPLTGSVVFEFFNNSNENTCSGEPVSTETVAVNGSTAQSSPHLNLAAGSYAFDARYVAGNDPNHNDSAASACEPFTINAAPTVATTLSAGEVVIGTSVHDSATLTGATSNAGGSVTYTVFDNTNCTPNANTRDGGTVAVSNGKVPDSNALLFNTAGDFYWQAAYSGDANNAAATSACTSEHLVVDRPAIAITKNPATQAVNSGGTATFTITVTNTGTVTLTNVTVTDPLSTNCAKTIGTLTPGQSTSYTCTKDSVFDPFTNVATVTGHPPVGPDVTASASANVTVIPPPPSSPPSTPAPSITDLAIVKTVDNASVLKGSNVTYTLTVTNNGPTTDTNVQVADSLPAGVTYVSSTASQGSCSGTAVVQCNLGTMTVGQKVTITIVVNTVNTGTIVNTTTVVGALPETTLTNNTSSVSIDVTAPPAPKPAPKPFKPPVVKPKPKPVPPPCYALVVAPKSLTVGKNAKLQFHVTAKNKGISGVKVEVKGAGILKLSGRTNSAGKVTLLLHPKKPGIVLVKPASYKGCANPRIGVIGAFTPPVTG